MKLSLPAGLFFLTLFGGIAFMGYHLSIDLPDPLSAEESALLRAASEERERGLCQIAAACRDFSDAQQECAVADDFWNCVEAKMGERWSLTGLCSEDGKYVDLPSDMPRRTECVRHDNPPTWAFESP